MTTTAQLQRIEKAQLEYFQTAKAIGVTSDTLRLFRAGGYVAQPKQLEFHAACHACDEPGGPSQIGFGGARGPGKSHALFAQIALSDCQRFTELKVLFLRKIAKNAREQFEDLRRNILRHVEHDYKRQEGIIYFPNGSRILIGHFKNESDIDSYLGLEYDIIVIEEATALTVSKYKTLRDSNRTSKDGFRPRIYCSTNPGGVGHGWFKDRFIKPAREAKETDTRFVFATVDDNAFIDPDYTAKLEDNTGWKLKAYRYGDWDIAAGQFFTTFRFDRHVYEQKSFMELPANAVYWCSLDYGFTHYTVCYLFMRYDGKTYILDEFAERRQLVSQNADGIKNMLQRNGLVVNKLSTFLAGHDCFANRGGATGESIADEYRKFGVILRRANIDRIAGASKLLQMLGDLDRKDKPIEPTIAISDRCVRLIDTIPSLQHDPNRPEDVLKVDMDEEGNGGDDSYDGARYGIMTNAGPGIWF